MCIQTLPHCQKSLVGIWVHKQQWGNQTYDLVLNQNQSVKCMFIPISTEVVSFSLVLDATF